MEAVPTHTSPAVFQCRSPNPPSAAWRVAMMMLVGAMVGAVAWYGMDQNLTLAHVAGWLLAGIAVFTPFAWFIERNPVFSIEIADTGLTIVRANGTRQLAWADIEAARLQGYPFAHSGGQTIRCFLLRAAGETFELTPEFIDNATRDAFEGALFRELESRDIPETAKALPSFDRMLSLGGAWLFIASIAGILAAQAAGFHTLGTILGSASLLTGSSIAWMTRQQRLSRVVLISTIFLIVASSAILWSCHVNVRDELQKLEWMDKRQ